MLKIHTKDGHTVRVDLEDPEQSKQWLSRSVDPDYQESITGLTLAREGVQYSIPRPKGFDPVAFLAEWVEPEPERKIKGGERITCLAGDVRVTIMVHREQRAARLSLLRTGKRRFDPMASKE